MKALKVKISARLKIVRDSISKSVLGNIEIVDDNSHDLLISDIIPDGTQRFIVVWDRHDIKEIEQKILEIKNSRHKYLRGIFLISDLEKSPDLLLRTLNEIVDEVNFRDIIKEKAQANKADKDYFEIGSLVRIKDKIELSQLENIYSQPRFTSLFIDKPMLQLMYHLSRILEEMQSAISNLEKDYKAQIGTVMKKSGLDDKKSFDQSLIEELQKKKRIIPVRLEPILLTGETGVGKTLIARWIHGGDSADISKQRFPGSFQEVNASGLSMTLLESEMFGHVKGTFTDAKQDKPGKALLALGGVLFLDEIGDMPLEIQPRIMKYIEEMTFTPEGWTGVNSIYTPTLVVAATNKNLEEEVGKGTFRRDLYARFRHRVHIPSIKDRKESLHVIVDFIVQNPAVNRGGKVKYIANGAIEKLKSFKCAENYRGLERIVKDAAYRALECGLDIILPELVEEK